MITSLSLNNPLALPLLCLCFMNSFWGSNRWIHNFDFVSFLFFFSSFLFCFEPFLDSFLRNRLSTIRTTLNGCIRNIFFKNIILHHVFPTMIWYMLHGKDGSNIIDDRSFLGGIHPNKSNIYSKNCLVQIWENEIYAVWGNGWDNFENACLGKYLSISSFERRSYNFLKTRRLVDNLQVEGLDDEPELEVGAELGVELVLD